MRCPCTSGQRYWLWRAVDNEGEVLDFVVQRRRDAKVAAKLLRRLLKRHKIRPTRIVTSNCVRIGDVSHLGLMGVHGQGLRANGRAENSHLPIRRRERKLQRFNLDPTHLGELT
jgi:transposase-like protein